MTAPHDLDWPAALDSLEAEHDITPVEVAAPQQELNISPDLNLHCGDFNVLYRLLLAATRRKMAAAAILATASPGSDEYERAATAWDAACDECGKVENALWELEPDEGPSGFAAMYFTIKL